MKKGVFLSLAAVLVIVSLGFAVIAYAKPIEIKYFGNWTGGPYLEIEKAVVDRFNKLHAGTIHVSFMPAPEAGDQELSLNKLSVMVAGGSQPDVAKVGRFQVGSIVSSGLLQPLDDLVARDKLDLGQFFPPTIREAEYGGKLYALPWNTDDRALFYNADLFEELGLDPKKPPRTWEELDEYCKKIDYQNPDRKWKRVGFLPWVGAWCFCGWLWSAGGDLLDKANTRVTWAEDPGVYAAEWMQRYVHKYGWNVQYAKSFKPGELWEFWTGSLAMMVTGSWELSRMKACAPDTKFEVAPPPRPKGLEKDPITWCGGFALAVPAGVPKERRDAAWEFIKFYCADEWAQTLLGSKSGTIPVVSAAAFSKEFLFMDPLIKKLVSLMPYGRFRPVIPVGAELWEIYQNRIYSLLAQDELPARQIVEETARLGQAILDKGWERAKAR